MKRLYKLLDLLRFVFIALIMGMLIYKYMNTNALHLELNYYLQTTIFILIAIEAFRLFGPKQDR